MLCRPVEPFETNTGQEIQTLGTSLSVPAVRQAHNESWQKNLDDDASVVPQLGTWRVGQY